MEVDAQLAFRREARERLMFPDRRIAFNVRTDPGGKYKKTRVDPAAFAGRFLLKAEDAASVRLQGAESSRRLYCSDCCERAFAPVQSD